MGVPKFYRWLSERYPKISQRWGCRPSREIVQEHFGGGGGGGGGGDDDNDAGGGDVGGGTGTGDGDAPADHTDPYLSPADFLSPPKILEPDPLSECGVMPPQVDRLYIDMNGIIHGCSHSNNSDENGEEDDGGDVPSSLTEDQIVANVCYYLDRVVREIAQPREILYLAVDGVAPRAKLNQQRGRRYRSGKEGEIERTVYDAYLSDLQHQQQEEELEEERGAENWHHHHQVHPEVKQVGPGRFAGKFEARADDNKAASSSSEDATGSNSTTVSHPTSDGDGGQQGTAGGSDDDDEGLREDEEDNRATADEDEGDPFHSVAITPGTKFLVDCSRRIEEFVRSKLASGDERWRDLTVIYSGPDVPGEGEHKIMQFIREQQQVRHPDSAAAARGGTGGGRGIRHCVMGQDGDLILLGLVTHEPNLMLLREQVLFDSKLRKFEAWLDGGGAPFSESSSAAAVEEVEGSGKNVGGGGGGATAPTVTTTNRAVDYYVHNPNFEFLHMNVLRDYLALELECSNVLPDSPYDLERTIDDVVFLTFFVGNDFLPHMPALDIADEALDFLLYAYREQRQKWQKTGKEPYLTKAGEIVSGSRLESFLSVIGAHETRYYDYKQSTHDPEGLRRYEAKFGMTTTPSDQVLDMKEASDRMRYREMMLDSLSQKGDEEFQPAMTSKLKNTNGNSKKNDSNNGREVPYASDGDDEAEEEIVSRMGHLLEYSISSSSSGDDDGSGSKSVSDDKDAILEQIDDQDLKGRYYYDKFGFSPFDADKHTALRKAYVEGLVWNLQYYYKGCVSWDWYYPYHYGPMISDLVGLDGILSNISFEGRMGKPIEPFQQLMACLPPSHANLLPEPFRHLMTDESSPIADFYPRTFTIDMNGKRLPWEAVILLPFIDLKRLLEASGNVDLTSLSEEELSRNRCGTTVVLSRDDSVKESSAAAEEELESAAAGTATDGSGKGIVKSTPFILSSLYLQDPMRPPLFRPELPDGVDVPLSGLPTLRDGTIASMWRKRIRVNVHGSKSRYKTACLEMKNVLPEMIPIELLAQQLIGTCVYINYPHFIPAFVTAISDSRDVIRGPNSRPRSWSTQEAASRKTRLTRVISNYVFGDRYVGTGGLALAPGGTAMEDLEILLYVRPLRGLKTLPDGTVGKIFAKFEVEVPLFVTSWMPVREDERLVNVPALLERDPFNASRIVITDTPKTRFKEGRNVRKYADPSYRGGSASTSQNGTNRLAEAGIAAIRSFHSIPPARVAKASGCRLLRPQSTYGTFVPALPSSIFCNLRGLPSPMTRNNSSMITSTTPHVITPTKLGTSRIISTTRSRMRFISAGGSARQRMAVFGAVVAMSLFSSVVKAAVLFGVAGGGVMPGESSVLPPPARTAAEAVRGIARGGGIGSADPLESAPAKPLEFEHGTTTLSFTFDGGVVVAVDSRASLGHFVGSKTTKKVLPIHSHLLGTMAGGAADCMFWIRSLKAEAAMHELQEGRRMSVSRASRLLSNALYRNRGLGLSMGTMICGFDDEEAGSASSPKIYYVDDTGMRIESDMFAVGSGSTYALGVLDVERRPDMTADEAVALAIKAIRHATFRDAGSGGYINVYLITREHGWKHVFTEDLARLVDGYDHNSSNSKPRS